MIQLRDAEASGVQHDADVLAAQPEGRVAFTEMKSVGATRGRRVVRRELPQQLFKLCS